jgi:cytochrome P450
VCPGMSLAYMETVAAVAALITRFDVDLACPVEEVVRTLHFVARANKVPVFLTPRSNH